MSDESQNDLPVEPERPATAGESSGEAFTTETNQQTQAISAQPSNVENLVETWFNDHFPGSIVARSAEVWNHVQQAKENLKARLRALDANL